MTTQAFNFLWLNLDFPAPLDPADGSIRQPMPENYIENVRAAGERHPKADIMLWVDSRRLTEKQMKYLKAKIEQDRPNVRLMDLRDITAYREEKLYNEGETHSDWRSNHGKSSMIWRQVDCAKILISLQGDAEQKFFADMDYAHIDIDDKDMQEMLKKAGLIVGKVKGIIENQVWGFLPQRRDFFQHYYKVALERAYQNENGWNALLEKIDELRNSEDLGWDDVGFKFRNDGSQAEHPDHAWREGDASSSAPVLISKETLSTVFNAAQPEKHPEKPLSLAWIKACLRSIRLPALTTRKSPSMEKNP